MCSGGCPGLRSRPWWLTTRPVGTSESWQRSMASTARRSRRISLGLEHGCPGPVDAQIDEAVRLYGHGYGSRKASRVVNPVRPGRHRLPQRGDMTRPKSDTRCRRSQLPTRPLGPTMPMSGSSAVARERGGGTASECPLPSRRPRAKAYLAALAWCALLDHGRRPEGYPCFRPRTGDERREWSATRVASTTAQGDSGVGLDAHCAAIQAEARTSSRSRSRRRASRGPRRDGPRTTSP